jgi:hypothetical protein
MEVPKGLIEGSRPGIYLWLSTQIEKILLSNSSSSPAQFFLLPEHR